MLYPSAIAVFVVVTTFFCRHVLLAEATIIASLIMIFMPIYFFRRDLNKHRTIAKSIALRKKDWVLRLSSSRVSVEHIAANADVENPTTRVESLQQMHTHIPF